MNSAPELSMSHDIADPEKCQIALTHEITEGCLNAVSWQDFVTDATTLTHLKKTGRGVIKIYLGYFPTDETMLPFEPYLRALVQLYWQEAITEADFCQQVENHIKLIRNADMRYNLCQDYDEAIYQNYHLNFAAYGYKARERISQFLGYEPDLRHSLLAEFWMRDLLSDDTYKMPDEITPDDIRAITLIKYREVLLEKGQQAADTSPLWG